MVRAPWRERHIIDAFKGLTGPFVVTAMAVMGALDRVDAWVYLAIHGVYGLLWVIKSRVFGDRNWERPLTLWRALLLTVGLAGYWAAPVLLCAQSDSASPPLIALSVALFGLGVFLHFAADMQKHAHLTHRAGVLLTDGLWSRTRNPNYLGELLIYTSFSLLARHWLPWAIFGSVVVLEWVPNMMRKDRSLARYPEFAHWKANTGVLIPRLSIRDLRRQELP